jgi:hypothetical protein
VFCVDAMECSAEESLGPHVDDDRGMDKVDGSGWVVNETGLQRDITESA